MAATIPPGKGLESGVDRTKAAARESATWLKDEAGRLYAGYAKQSKYFKWKSWIIGGYAAVALFSLFMGAPPLNSIDAYVIPSYDVSSREFMVSVKNESTEPWTNVRLKLDDAFLFEKDALPPGESVLAKVTQFHRVELKGEKAPLAFRPNELRIRTDQGSFRVNLAQ